jgi:Carbohydrate esterase, sialic acid-specific acetylesterase/Immunoglobulin I-set domain
VMLIYKKKSANCIQSIVNFQLALNLFINAQIHEKMYNFTNRNRSTLNQTKWFSPSFGLAVLLIVLPLVGCGGNNKDDDNDNGSVLAITAQPANLKVTELQPASFSVTATGAAPLSYQWRRNGITVAGATSATLKITSALAADHGAKYSAVVTNSTGSVTSTEAVLTQELPMFLLAGQSNMEGNAEASLFQTILPELASGASTETIKTNLAEQIRVWHLVPGANRGYGYSATVAAFEASEMVRLNAAGLVGADLTTPNTKVLCAWNSATVAPLVFSMQPTRCGGPGPELVFGQALSKAGYSSTSLIKVAHGGTNLYADWRSPLSGGTVSSRDLYAQLRSRIKSLKSAPTSVNPSCDKRTCRWSAFVWFQGENDVFDKDYGLAYEQNLKNLIADVRSDVGSPTLPVVIVQIGSWAQSISAGGKNVANAQTAVVNADKYARIVNTADLSGYYHYDSAAQLIIGERVALAVKSLLAAESAPK